MSNLVAPGTVPTPARLEAVRPYVDGAAVVAVLAWWATWLTWGTGGREPHVLSVGCVLLLGAHLLVRPDRRLPVPVLVVGHAVAVGAWAVVALAPTGWHGRDDAASWTFAAELFLVLLAWAGSTVRRMLVAAAVLAASGAQFAAGWLPWWGAQDQAKLFQGTFYWHNQAGVFLAAGAVLALAVLAVPGPLSRLGWVVAPLAVAGTVYTTSRGSLLALLLGAGLLVACAATSRHWRAALRVLLGAGLSWLVTVGLAGPPFFAERAAPTAGVEARAGSFVGNGVQRLEDWRRAWEIFREWPVTGAGFDSFRHATTVVTTRRDGVDTAFAHNGYLQALSDGGLLLGAPLCLALGWLVVGVVRALPTAARRADLLQLGGVAALVVLLLHSGMDFDWAYPALLALLAPVAVLALPLGASRRRAARERASYPSRTVTWSSTGLATGLLLLSAAAAWSGGLALNTTF